MDCESVGGGGSGSKDPLNDFGPQDIAFHPGAPSRQQSEAVKMGTEFNKQPAAAAGEGGAIKTTHHQPPLSMAIKKEAEDTHISNSSGLEGGLNNLLMGYKEADHRPNKKPSKDHKLGMLITRLASADLSCRSAAATPLVQCSCGDALGLCYSHVDDDIFFCRFQKQ